MSVSVRDKPAAEVRREVPIGMPDCAVEQLGVSRNGGYAGITGSGPVGWESDPGNVLTVNRPIDGISTVERQEKAFAAKIINETDSGIVVSGAHLVSTLCAYADDILVMPSIFVATIAEAAPCAFGFLDPGCSPGLRYICRLSVVHQNAASPMDFPLSSRLDEGDGQSNLWNLMSFSIGKWQPEMAGLPWKWRVSEHHGPCPPDQAGGDPAALTARCAPAWAMCSWSIEAGLQPRIYASPYCRDLSMTFCTEGYDKTK